MVPPKSQNEIDKLLEIATKVTPVKVKKPKTNPEIDQFIQELKIIAGKSKVPTSIIYYHYFAWKKIRLISRKKFLSYFKTKFEKTRTDHGIGYLLNPKPFDLSPQGFFKARALLRRERDERKKETT